MMLKKHFKLYKSGKQWCIAAVVTFAATLGLVAGNTTVNADTLTTGGSTPQAQLILVSLLLIKEKLVILGM